MNVLHLSAVKTWGGGEHHIENLCYELKHKHPEHKNLILCVKDSVFHQRLQETDLNYSTGTLAIKIDIRYALKIGFLCRKHKIDLIHIHDPSAIQLAIIADKIFNLPPFVFSKKTSFPIKQRKKTLFKYNYPKIKKILCVSNETMRVAEKGIRDHSKLITVYDGTHIPKSSLTPYELRNKFNLSKEHFVIGNIANHIRAKHLDTLIDIADELVNRRKIKELIFVQIGMFTDRTENLKRRVEALNLEDHVHFLGYLKDAPNFIPQFDLSLMTSQSEGLPHFIYESMYFKVPVVSTDVGGIREVIVNGKNGYLSPKHNAVSLGENILKLKADPVMREKFAQLSYERLMDGFTTEVMAEQTYKVYKEIMDELPK